MTDNGVVKPFVNSAMNQYTTVNGQAATYDNDFNLTAYAGNTFVYNAQNQLVGGSLQATYDGLGRCVKRTVAGVTRLFTYDDWKPILEWDSSGNWVAWNVYGAGPDEILARYDSGGRHLIYKQDQHGNVVAVLGATGVVAEKYRYDAFGRPTIMNGTGTILSQTAIANRFMFQGREWIAELGVYDYRHRFYNPDLGRFLQADPTGFEAGDMNLFRYCDDDPVDGSDPTGLFDMWGKLTDFYNGNPSIDVVRDAWNQQRFGGLTMGPIGLSRSVQVPDHPRNSDGSELAVYGDSVTAARSQEQAVGAAVKTVKTTEVISEVGQAQDGSARYVAINPHVGIGVKKAWSGKAQQSIGDARNLPLGYQHLVGFVLGHIYYDGRFVDHDINVAKVSNYKVAIIIGEIFGKGNKSVTYEKGKPDPIY
jgi:RHS repeat-associated protein